MAIEVNLEVYRESGRRAPEITPASRHLENPEFHDLVFAYVDVSGPEEMAAA
jgi:hypothetical protein